LSARTKGDGGGAPLGGPPEEQDQGHGGAGCDFGDEERKGGAQGGRARERGEGGEGRGVDEKQRPEAADADAGVFQDLAAPALTSPDH
jgi:hypothetical protein